MAITGTCMVPHPPLLIPEVGRGQERQISATVEAYQDVAGEIAKLRPETLVVLSPHSVMYSDYFHISPGEDARGDFGQFGAGKVKIEAVYDQEFVRLLCAKAQDGDLQAGVLGEREMRLDHGTMVPLYFVNQRYTGYRLVRIGLSGLPLSEHYRLGQMIRDTANELGRNTVVVASGDLSHKLKEEGPYGFQKEGPAYDERIMEVMGSGRFGELFEFSEDFCDKAAECGHRSFVVMAGALDRQAVRVCRMTHEGNFGVGYGICMFWPEGEDPSRDFLRQYEQRQREAARERRGQEDAYVRLARLSLETYVREHRILKMPDDLPPELAGKKAGAFVSLKKGGRLRGCIGTISAVRACLGEEIIENAVSAGTQDPRFPPVTPGELDELVYSVDVLGEIQPVASEEELDPSRYGVIVRKGRKRGLLLPNLEGVDTVEEQIAIAREKAGIGDHEKGIALERFEVVRHR